MLDKLLALTYILFIGGNEPPRTKENKMSKSNVDIFIKHANRSLVRCNDKRCQQNKAENKVTKLKAQIAAIEEMIQDLSWEAACAGNEANEQRSCFEWNMDKARLEYCKDLEGDNAAKHAEWQKFLMAVGLYNF